MEDLLKEFTKLSSQKYMLNDVPNYAYAAGYYESVMASMFRQLSKVDQEQFKQLMESGLRTLQGE